MVDSGVAGEGRVVGIPKFHSWGKCTMPLTNINSDECPTPPLACVLIILFILCRSFKLHLGCSNITQYKTQARGNEFVL